LKKAGFQKVVSWTDQNEHFMVCFASFAWGLRYFKPFRPNSFLRSPNLPG
jgi:hypothetical protein